MKLLTLFTSSLLLITNIAEAKTIKRYAFESAVVKYKITGQGKVMGIDTNTSGTKSLYFKNYGSQLIEESEQTITQFGDTKDERRTRTLKKFDDSTLYNVNFKQKKILKTTDPIVNQYQEIEADLNNQGHLILLLEQGGKKVGMDKVLNLKCEIWNIMGTSQCLYKNQIPLWIEADVMGLKQKTIVSDIKFNVNISDTAFELPKYSIEVLTMQTSLETTKQK